MKKLFLILALVATATDMLAQDDMYYRPQKKSTVKAATYTYYSGSDRDVDEYNRRGKYASVDFDVDSMLVAEAIQDTTVKVVNINIYNGDEYRYSRDIDRWYGSYCYDPWYWGWGVGFSFGWGWVGPYYHPGWYGPWRDPWYDPWCGPGWYRPWCGPGWYRPWGPGWHRPWGPGYIAYGGNPRGFSGNRSWGGRGDGRVYGGRSYSSGGYRSHVSNIGFGGRSSNGTRVSGNATGFGSHRSYSGSNGGGSSRSYSPSSSGSSYSGGGFGGHSGGSSGGGFGGHSSGGGFGGGGGHSGGGGGFGGRH